MKIHLFNPENDLALADGNANYCPPPAATTIAYDLASLPVWFANGNDAVLLPDTLHTLFNEECSLLFNIAKPYGIDSGKVEALIPWGWSAQVVRRFKAMGFSQELLPPDANIDAIRHLSNRLTSISILKALRESGIETPPLPRYLTHIADVADFVNERPRCVIKAPWSGSGKGIAWGIGRLETPVANFCKGVIRRQGGVVCEEYLDALREFAMEFYYDGSSVTFAGYSLFESEKGAYSGNWLATDNAIETVLAEYIPKNHLQTVKVRLSEILLELLKGCGYVGYLGVDMMIYSDGEKLRLNPCMELNLRMNMGMVARLFYDRYVVGGREGIYKVAFYKKSGEAYVAHLHNKKKYPLLLRDGRIVSGYLNLSPVTPNSRYAAYVIVG